MIIKVMTKLAWQSLCYRLGAMLITIAAIAVSVFTLFSVEHLRQTAKQSFSSTVSGVDLIVGPRTGGINLLLTTVFRIGQPAQNMSWDSYQNLVDNPRVSWTIPISLGDSHKGFRVIGTEQQFFSHFRFGQSRALAFSEGNAFSKTFQVVLGANVAQQLGYTNGQKLVIAHGISMTSFQVHDTFPFQVSGILKPTGTPVDNALYVSLEGLESIHQTSTLHAITNEPSLLKPKSISAALVGLTSKLSTFKVQRDINSFAGEPLTAILPGVTLSQLWQMIRGVESTLTLMAKLILLASLLGLGAIMIATLRERTYEFSVLRTLGLEPIAIFLLIQMETLIICILGVLLGGVIFILSSLLFGNDVLIAYGIDISMVQMSPSQGFIVLYALLGSLFVGVFPAINGYIRSRRK